MVLGSREEEEEDVFWLDFLPKLLHNYSEPDVGVVLVVVRGIKITIVLFLNNHNKQRAAGARFSSCRARPKDW